MAEAGRTLAKKLFRHRFEGAMATYAGTRAAAEITTALLSVGAGAVVVKQATPSVMTIGRALAVTFAGILADPVHSGSWGYISAIYCA